MKLDKIDDRSLLCEAVRLGAFTLRGGLSETWLAAQDPWTRVPEAVTVDEIEAEVKKRAILVPKEKEVE